MSITKGQDYNRTNFNDTLFGLYYYCLDWNKFNSADTHKNSFVFAWCPTIQTLCFNPFLEMNDINNVTECELDKEYFKISSSYVTPSVFRCLFEEIKKKLGVINLQNEYKNLYSSNKNFETRLLFYPYKYYLLSDGINPPLMIKPELLKSTSDNNIMVRITLSQTSKYNIFIEGFKKDNGEGQLEGIINNVPLLYPIGSNAYTNYLMTSGNTFNQLNNNALMENDLTLKQNTQSLELSKNQNLLNAGLGVVGSGIGLFTGNIAGGLMGITNNIVSGYYGNEQNKMQGQFNKQNYNMKEYQIESMALAKTNDLLNTPRTMKSMGNDSVFNVFNSGNSLKLYEFGLQERYKSRIEHYFRKYGYRVNRYKKPNTNTRKYFNFVKCIKCDVDSSKIPYNDLQEIESIFESGVTLWHIDNGATVKNYNVQNLEV